MTAMTRTDWDKQRTIIRVFLTVNLVLMVWMLYMVAEPYLSGVTRGSAAKEEPKLKLPAYDYAAWEQFPVLEGGRVKPLLTVAVETVREVTGRVRFEDQPPVAVLLSWLFSGTSASGGSVDWDHYSFILCEDRELRAAIYGVDMDDPAAHDKVFGKRISPVDLKNSVPFQRLMVEVTKARTADPQNFRQNLEPLQRKAMSVSERLSAYERLKPSEKMPDSDPIHFVALDRVPNAPWFSAGELRFITMNHNAAPNAPADMAAAHNWQVFLRQRVSLTPQLYLPEDVKKALADLKTGIRNKKLDQPFAELEQTFTKRRDEAIAKIEKMSAAEGARIYGSIFQRQISEKDFKDEQRAQLLRAFTQFQKMQDEKVITDLKNRIQAIERPYIAEDPKYSQLYMDYLEARFPDMYKEATTSQPFPAEDAKTFLASYDSVAAAYRTGDPSQFNEASQAFFKTVSTVSQKFAGEHYPGTDTIDLELSLNRVEPFKWAWITMLLSTLLFAAALKTENKIVYTLGFLPLFISLAFQVYAYYGRVAISGRPPVSNMFETVVFVASMSAVFALILEAFYRKTIIILSGAAIATLGLILADQLPYGRGFSDKIDPLVPVLRSNYWLIVHVMTIVASYAAGALAWGIGNVSLVLYWFNSDRKDLLKMMANLSYSAIKIAVLLLGVGTLLGGIWAAESWGRFWGWDPKETWALIALVVYLLPLHARYVGWVKDFGLAVASVVCFAGIVMSWYGVNFILGAGLHSYGMGDGGPWTIFLLGSINLFWVLLVCHKRASREMALAVA
jgi:cytochrome c-type biogenesis protein CcsB